MRHSPTAAPLRAARFAALAAVTVVAALLSLAAPAGAAPPPDRSGAVTPDAPFTWTGPVTTAANQAFDPGVAEPCGKAAEDYCDATLINVQAGDFFSTSGGGVEFSTVGTVTDVPEDVDLYVYSADAAGNVTGFVGASAGQTAEERVSVQTPSGYYLVVAVYFDVTNAGYQGRAEFFRRAKTPPDVDDPEGFQDVLVSDPNKGYRSHSEPHLSQDPTNARILVGGSKFYNRDPDSLAEYEFKIGSYASFNRGRTWFDLGQLNTCPRQEAPPSTWPLLNRCYPLDDPTLGGTGPEDQNDPQGQGDYGEEYTTSDVWTDFDDEGNAYAMVLDDPGFPSGAGWGMSFHRWETPSSNDIQRGRTWSERIPINAYPTLPDQETTLDDKNTFAVNNAGPDHDGKTGIIVACWGQNYDLANFGRQQQVCERSTDGGRSWPDAPTPISPPQEPPLPFGPFEIGVHVVADTRDPNTFYAVWLDTLSGFLDGSGLSPFWFTRTTDGAQTWEPARIVGRIEQLPGIFPRQAFRNLSLPIMAVGPAGEIYVTYADYNPAPYAASDEDGMQADIKIIKSTDHGQTWTDPKRINQDRTNADQFQPYVRVTRAGQVNVSFFDRRLDEPSLPEHPGNYFIDTWLARSGNGGRTWREERVSHDASDPAINPPISGSGEFFGDYQGLVADECFAIPFVNDTHLANDPARDPEFDRNEPRSQFQQVVAYRVPNTREFGGGQRDCRAERPDRAGAGAGAGAETPAAAGSRGVTVTRAARRAIKRHPAAVAKQFRRLPDSGPRRR